MCISCAVSVGHGRITRRSVLAGTGAIAASIGLAACAPKAATEPVPAPQTSDVLPTPIGDEKFEVVLLGTMAGPPIEPDRTGISTALVVDGQVYLVDCGRASASQYVRSGLQQHRLNSIFLTHLHADHVADYYNFLMLGGNITNRAGDRVADPVRVFGPGPADGLPPKFGGGDVATVGDNPTPGTAEMTRMLHNAYAYSANIFLRDTGIRDIRTLLDVNEITVPDVGANFRSTAPDMEPFIVMEDDRVRVTATLVPHGPCYPAFAFRFETNYGSVTLSGDTTYSSNLIRLAQDTDLLVHEAINVQGGELPPAVLSHMLQSHVEIQKVGPIAEEAGAKRLVLSHIGDVFNSPIDTEAWQSWAQAGFSGEVIVGSDLQRIKLA